MSQKLKPIPVREVIVSVCLTVDVVDGKSVEAGHVSVLSEGSVLLRRLYWLPIIQILEQRRSTIRCGIIIVAKLNVTRGLNRCILICVCMIGFCNGQYTLSSILN